METYLVDIDARQIVRWLKAERKAGVSALRVNARRSREVRGIPVQDELGLGDAEREDLSEVATIATLDIEPVHANDGWRLSIVIEDEIGPRCSDRFMDREEEQQIDLETFYDEFIAQGRGNANVIVEVENPEAEERLQRLLAAIEENRHEP